MGPSYEPKEPPARKHTIARKPVATTPSRYDPPPLRSLPRHSPTLVSRIRTRWSFMSKRLRVLVVFGVVVVLALILGLAIGLGTRSKTQNLPLPGGNGGPFSGELTYYDPGLGSCGVTSSSSQNIVAVAHSLYDAAQTGSDPNQNPLCGRKIRAKRVKEGSGERSVDLTVVDRCTGCAPKDIDVSLSVFKQLADPDLGRVDVTWNWL
ncbi:uncharacterized protein AB675_444 [Cyphellophora attinorum]|uniref:RlpA-like protein double-psi beta-barrel domain-containing protein n=1 Tax=Cyphellophora attinorum TaxID=1664694 RepID=A0A0N1I115_9EURO|nr:uncharacterized protein AB675_444 [Phialophora attinorum]KPI45403.1 hypothetical protein AB675_444 [Phialophora attinorum]